MCEGKVTSHHSYYGEEIGASREFANLQTPQAPQWPPYKDEMTVT